MISPGHKKDKKLDKEQVSGSLEDSVNRVKIICRSCHKGLQSCTELTQIT